MYYRKDIDGLRGVSVILVFLFHLNILDGGYLGVDIFFVISGFLITGLVFKEINENKFSLLRFYERRIRRICPMLFLVCFLTFPLAYILMYPDQLTEYGESLIGTSLNISNIIFYLQSGYFEENANFKPLLHIWSISIEEQFYIFFPLVILFFVKFLNKQQISIVFCLLFIFFLFLTIVTERNTNSAIYFKSELRFFEILIGVLGFLYKEKILYLFDKNNLKVYKNYFPYFGLILICLSIIKINITSSTYNHPGIFTLIPTIGAVLILIFNNNESMLSQFLKFKPLVFTGLISYSIYLIHYPIISYVNLYLFKDTLVMQDLTILNKVLIFIVTFIMAFLSWKFIEKPSRNLNFLNQKKIFTIYFGIIILVTSTGFYIKINNGFIERYNSEKNNLAIKFHMAEKDITTFNDICRNQDKKNKTKLCILGDLNSEDKIMLIGDSQKETLEVSINNFGIKNKIKVYNINHCENFDDILENPFCENAILVAKKNNINKIVINYFWKDKLEKNVYGKKVKKEEDEKKKNILEFLNKFNYDKIDFFIIYPLAQQKNHVPRELLRRLKANSKDLIIKRDYAEIKKDLKNVENFLDEIKAHNSKVTKIKPNDYLCDSFIKKYCVGNNDNQIFYIDSHHLSNTGSDFVLNKSLFKKILNQ